MARRPRKAPTLDLESLLTSWELHLRAERKSPQTVKTYGDGVRAFLKWATDNGQAPTLNRDLLKAFTVALLDSGAKPATATSRHLALRRFAAWLTDEGELDANPLLGVKAPKLDQPITEPLTDAELKGMLNACRGTELRDLRDAAIIRLMFTTGARAGEVVALRLEDVHAKETPPYVVIRRGKGGKGRLVPLAPEVAVALDRYIRKGRTGHLRADTGELWVGDRGKGFTYDALHKTLKYRAELAGITGFHPHKLRHTAAHRWLERGGSEGGLMAVAGWTRPDMLVRYTRARASERAAEEAQRLDLGAL